MYQPPEPSGVGRCLRCNSFVEESEQIAGFCYECQPAEAGDQPAFPVQASDYGGHGTCFGLTIRDYFAAKALQGLISTAGAPFLLGMAGCENETASTAYKLADAMLAARVRP